MKLFSGHSSQRTSVLRISSFKWYRHAGVLAVLLAVCSLPGCRKPEVELAQVSGTVRLDGEPLSNATVRFLPEGKGRAAIGKTDESGKYVMLYSATADGAVVGKVRVEITTAEEATDQRGRTTMLKEILPSRYHETSELTADVTPRSNEINFDLNSK